LVAKKNRAQRDMQRALESQQGRLVAAGIARSGPLPTPQDFAGYEAVLPGSAERILKMAETQSEHRMGLEKRTLDHNMRRSNQGLWIAAGLQITFLGVSAALVFTGHEAAGTVVGSVDLVGLATTFIYGTASGKDERLRRARIMAGRPEESN
jgi:uncharacterized membrane protein